MSMKAIFCGVLPRLGPPPDLGTRADFAVAKRDHHDRAEVLNWPPPTQPPRCCGPPLTACISVRSSRGWATDDGPTDITELALACVPTTAWSKRADGPLNDYLHPEKYLLSGDDS